MNRSAAIRFLRGAAVWAVMTAILLGGAVAVRDVGLLGWALLGWVTMALVGLAQGSVLAGVHGRRDHVFLGAMTAGMAARLLAAIGGGVAAFFSGETAGIVYCIGLAAGYLPVQLYEAVWFLRGSLTWTRNHQEGVS